MKKEQARALWDISFNDNEEFTELYFEKRYTDDNTVGIQNDEGTIVSVLQLLPYPFTFLNNKVNSAYISGACTHPEYRSQGLMPKLMRKSFQKLQQDNIPICTLIPAETWLFNYYNRSGFETLFYSYSHTVEVNKIKNDLSSEIEEYDQVEHQTHLYLNKKLQELPSAILHTQQDYEVILADLRLAKGKVFTAYQNNKVVGMAIAYANPLDKSVYINEMLYDAAVIKEDLLHHIAKYFNCTSFHITSLITDTRKEPLGMLRIIDVEYILKLFADQKPEWNAVLKIEDELLPVNNGIYVIEKGNVTKSHQESNQTATLLTVGELAIHLFENLQPYMSLMLN